MASQTITILLTGATDGIGRQTALELARRAERPTRLLLHGRNTERLAETLAEVGAVAADSVSAETIEADLSSLEAVRAMAAEVQGRVETLDVLLNNAGIYATEGQRSADGFELTMAVNHLAPFLLTHLLWPRLSAAPAARVVNVSSIAHNRGSLDAATFEALPARYDGYGAYAASKLANVLFTLELARRVEAQAERPAVTVNALHPGVVSTKLLQEGFGMEGPDSLAEGAATSIFLATCDDVAKVNGRYFLRCKEAPMAEITGDAELCRRFYQRSCALVGIEGLA